MVRVYVVEVNDSSLISFRSDWLDMCESNKVHPSKYAIGIDQ